MANSESSKSQRDLIDAGYEAIGRGAWQESRDRFLAAVREGETAEALEGLALAAWWLDDVSIIFDARERAYNLYRERGDAAHAAGLATWLGFDHYIYRGEVAIANGWLQRARRLIEGLPPSVEEGWLALWGAHIALFEQHDVERAKRDGSRAVELGRLLGAPDLEFLGLALEGLALVIGGQVRDGMHRLDEATAAALSGEMSDPDAIITTCCYLIFACERVRDVERAAQWCVKAEAVAERWGYRSMFAFCRCHYAVVLIWRGEWDRAERELMEASKELLATRPGWARESLVRLGELRRRQGHLDEAGELFERAQGHPYALFGKAELALDRDDAVSAADLVERYLRRIPHESRTDRAAGLELAARVQSSLGNDERAAEYLAELLEIAAIVDTAPMHAAAALTRGVTAASRGDLEGGRRCLEDAVDLFQRYGAPYETARARIHLATVLANTGRSAAALAEAKAALDAFGAIGAERDSARAAALVRTLGGEVNPARSMSFPAGLSRRETEVLRAIALGASNAAIADELFISVRTVEHHVSAVYAKIGAEGPAARAIATAYAIDAGLTSPHRDHP